MSFPTVQAILSHHEYLMEWDQPFLFRTADGIINVASVIGTGADTPDEARNQPFHYPQFCHPKHTTHYRFDSETYKGKNSLELLLHKRMYGPS